MTQTLETLRRGAWQIFEQRGLPGRRDEDWKYTDLSRLESVLGGNWWQPANISESTAAEATDRGIPDLDAYRLVFSGGRIVGGSPELPKGVSIVPLSVLLAGDEEKAARVLALDPTAPLFNGTVAVNSALATDGACICIASGVTLDKPLYVLHLADQPGASQLRHGIWMEENSRAQCIEHYAGENTGAGLTHAVTLAHLDAGARLEHCRLQEESGKQFHLGRIEAVQFRDSSFTSHSIALGAALSRVDIAVRLAGPGAACRLNGLYVTGGRQHADHHTHIAHAAPNCTSRESYQGILDGRSRAVFNGKVVVHRNAQQTDARQSNGNLLLSSRAEVDTKPELEIYADDVKCGHGASIGQLDETQVFYLRTRGLSEADARNVLTFAFADDVLARLPHTQVRRYLEHAVLARLPQGKVLEEWV